MLGIVRHFFSIIGLMASLAGAIMGYLEIKAIKMGDSDQTNRGLALIGLISGSVGVLVAIGVLILLTIVLVTA